MQHWILLKENIIFAKPYQRTMQCSALNVKFTPQRPICSELFWIRVRSKHAWLVVVVVMILLFLVLVVSVVVLVVGQPNPIPAAASSPTLLSRHCSRPAIIIIITNMTTNTIIVSKSAAVLLNEVEISTWLWFVRVVTVFSSPADASCNFKPGIYQCKPIPPSKSEIMSLWCWLHIPGCLPGLHLFWGIDDKY